METQVNAIIRRDDLISVKRFATMFDADCRTVQRVIRCRNLDCEIIIDNEKERYFINLDKFLDRAKVEGVNGLGMFRKLARLSKK